MSTIRLDSGQLFEVDQQGFQARIHFDFTPQQDFHVEAANLESNRRGNALAIRRPSGNTEVSVTPARGEFLPGTKLFSHVEIMRDDDQETRLELPTFSVGGLRSFPVLGVFSGVDTVKLQAGDASSDSALDSYSSVASTALRRSLDKDGGTDFRSTGVTVLVDVSASMKYSTDAKLFDMMCAFTTGVVSVLAGSSSVCVLTSSSRIRQEYLDSPEEIRALADRLSPQQEVGWDVDISRISSQDSVVVISDDLPVEILRLDNPVHLLTSRKPTVTHGRSFTYFDSGVIRAMEVHDSNQLMVAVREMFDALTAGSVKEN